MKRVLIFVMITVFIFVGYVLFKKEAKEEIPNISSFENCVQAGGVVMESYPKQCRWKNGLLFNQKIFGEETTELNIYFPNTTQTEYISDCSKLYPVKRLVKKSENLANAALWELLKGVKTEEKNEGYISFIHADTGLRTVKIREKTMEIDFDKAIKREIKNQCQVQGVMAQLRQTVTQFDTIDSIIVSIDGETENIFDVD